MTCVPSFGAVGHFCHELRRRCADFPDKAPGRYWLHFLLFRVGRLAGASRELSGVPVRGWSLRGRRHSHNPSRAILVSFHAVLPEVLHLACTYLRPFFVAQRYLRLLSAGTTTQIFAILTFRMLSSKKGACALLQLLSDECRIYIILGKSKSSFYSALY